MVKKKEKPEKAETKEKKPEERKIIFTVGKRKTAVARAALKPGKGVVRINSILLNFVKNEILRLKMQEPLILLGDDAKAFDVDVNVHGGGPMAQAEAARMAIARGFVEAIGQKAKERFLGYDRYMLVYDPRRAEPHKPPHSSWGGRRYKQRSKR